jgi:ectoine hydroxylase-related dioxygenase (phytanoyl-CoA dioxygenase family)
MDGNVVTVQREIFDEEAYLRRYPDIAKAVAAGKIPSGWMHYSNHGAAEGRKPNDFDEAFYMRAYPVAALDISEGRASSPFQHYLTIGRNRGFLPHPKAPRLQNPVAPASPFGGLWVDQPHVEDLIDGKLSVGLINEAQAEQLRFFARNGYVILPNAVPKAMLAKARAAVERAFDNGFAGLKFQCGAIARGELDWQPELQTLPSKALDLHHRSAIIRQLMFAPKIEAFLALIFDSKAFASQTLSFLRGSAQEGHQDSAYVVYTLPRHFAASWIALEDVTLGAGELFYYPGSHRFPDFQFNGTAKSVIEARRTGAKEPVLNEEIRKHVKLIEKRARDIGLRKEVFAAKAGDVLIWHSDLVHGGCPISTDVTRKSVVTHYCPRYAMPVFGEYRQMPLNELNGHLWTTSHYKDAPTDE